MSVIGLGELQHGRDAEPVGGAATEEPVGGVAVGDWKDNQNGKTVRIE